MSANSVNGSVDSGMIAYASLTDSQRGILAAGIDMSDTAGAMARLTELNSDKPVNDSDAKTLGFIQEFVLGLSTHKKNKKVSRFKKAGRHGNLEAFLASLNGSDCNIDPDTVVFIRDTDGNEIETTIGQGADKRRVPLVEVRGSAASASGVSVRLDSGEVFPLANGKRPSPSDVGGQEAYRRIAAFSRDGGETWQDVKWTLTLPNSRTSGK